jgi:hypothetical protein
MALAKSNRIAVSTSDAQSWIVKCYEEGLNDLTVQEVLRLLEGRDDLGILVSLCQQIDEAEEQQPAVDRSPGWQNRLLLELLQRDQVRARLLTVAQYSAGCLTHKVTRFDQSNTHKRMGTISSGGKRAACMHCSITPCAIPASSPVAELLFWRCPGGKEPLRSAATHQAMYGLC